MDKKVDFFQKKMSNSRSFSRQRRNSNVWMRILLIIFILCIAWLIFWRTALYTEEPETKQLEFSLWEQVYLHWELKADGDIITHTHTIEDPEYGKIWIKSDSINLSDYAWFVELTWLVEKFYEWNPIVKVLILSWTLAGEWENNTDIVFDENSWVYILWAWIQFLPSFFNEYVLLNEWENGEIHIQNIETEKEIVLNYFRCNSSNPDRNCKWLIESFENNQAQSSSNYEWDVYYRQGENQWFVANGDRWGIFIKDVSEDEVYKLKDLIKFANEKNINEWIKSRAASICQWSWEKMQKISNSEISLKQEWLIVTVSWDGMEKQMTCQILVDFSLPAKWKLQTLSIWDAVVILNETWSNEEMKTEVTWNIAEAPISATSLDTNVPQFPIKEEWLVYNSSRWGYTLKFPSSNISYSVSSAKENFGRSDVNCSYVINVIKYSDKENLEVSPAIRIYECQWSVEKSWAPGIVVYPRLDKKFVVQMNDGAWNDFSTNLKFEELTEE